MDELGKGDLGMVELQYKPQPEHQNMQVSMATLSSQTPTTITLTDSIETLTTRYTYHHQ